MKYVIPLTTPKSRPCTTCRPIIPHDAPGCAPIASLLSHQRYPIPQIARLSQVDQRRVSAWMERWQTWGVVGFSDRPRSGRPPIFNAEEQQTVYEYLDDVPKDVKKVVEAMEQKTQEARQYQNHQAFQQKKPCLETDQAVPSASTGTAKIPS